MSSDFGFWKEAAGDPEEIWDNLCDGDTTGVVASPDVLRFRTELLERWPDIVNALEPAEYELVEDPEITSKYVVLTLSVRQLDHLDDVHDLAKAHGLVGFSGVAGEPV